MHFLLVILQKVINHTPHEATNKLSGRFGGKNWKNL